MEKVINLLKEYEFMKATFPTCSEGQLWKMAAENFALGWMQRDITFKDYFDNLLDRIERRLTNKK